MNTLYEVLKLNFCIALINTHTHILMYIDNKSSTIHIAFYNMSFFLLYTFLIIQCTYWKNKLLFRSPLFTSI